MVFSCHLFLIYWRDKHKFIPVIRAASKHLTFSVVTATISCPEVMPVFIDMHRTPLCWHCLWWIYMYTENHLNFSLVSLKSRWKSLEIISLTFDTNVCSSVSLTSRMNQHAAAAWRSGRTGEAITPCHQAQKNKNKRHNCNNQKTRLTQRSRAAAMRGGCIAPHHVLFLHLPAYLHKWMRAWLRE